MNFTYTLKYYNLYYINVSKYLSHISKTKKYHESIFCK